MIKDTWNRFEDWVHSWLPGYKTKITTGLGTLGMVSATLQEYITGLPLEQVITAKTMALVSAGLFTLSFWFKRLGDKASD